MKPFRCIVILAFLFLTAWVGEGDGSKFSQTDAEEKDYVLLIDSVDAVVDDDYHDFTDSLLWPVLAYYEQKDDRNSLWMQARCHYLIGHLDFSASNFSESAVEHFVKALQILDRHFSPSDDEVCRLYSKICFQLSRVMFNFSDEASSKQVAKLGLEYALTAQDTVWIARSYATLGLLYEGFGRPGEGDTAYFYCNEGTRYVSPERYPREYARLCRAVGDCYRHSADYEQALKCFGQAKALLDSTSPLYHTVCVHEAFVYFRMQDYASAVTDLEQAFHTKDKNIRQQVAYGLSDCYEKLGDTAKAAQYFMYVKQHKEMEISQSRQNTNAVPMVKAYLAGRTEVRSKAFLPWMVSVMVVAMALVLFLLFRRDVRKRTAQQCEDADRKVEMARDALKEKSLEVLKEKAKTLYASKPRTAGKEILALFNEAYPDILPQLADTYPNLSEKEREVAIMNFFDFRIKEEAVLLHLSENTVMKYRSNLNKAAGSDPILSLIG